MGFQNLGTARFLRFQSFDAQRQQAVKHLHVRFKDAAVWLQAFGLACLRGCPVKQGLKALQFRSCTVEQHTCPWGAAQAGRSARVIRFCLVGKPLSGPRVAADETVQRHNDISKRVIITPTSITFHKLEKQTVLIFIFIFLFKELIKCIQPHQCCFGFVGNTEKGIKIQCMEVASYHLKAE